MNSNMQQISITTPHDVINEAKKINDLFDAGLQTMHLKKHHFGRSTIKKIINGVKPEYRNRLVLHHNYDLAIFNKVQGIHASVKKMRNPLFRLFVFILKLVNPKLLVSTTYGVNETKLTTGVDYAFVGPLYTKYSESNIKCNYKQYIVSELTKKSNCPLYALGGIEKSHIPVLNGLGFTGVVLKDSIWNAPDMVSAFLSFKRINDAGKRSMPMAS